MQRYGNGGKEEKPSIISAIGRPAHPLRGSREVRTYNKINKLQYVLVGGQQLRNAETLI
jgi:hypothetical protein